MAKKAYEFTLCDQDGAKQSLHDYRGRWVVLYFYPHDRSLNCTREACNFRDEYRIITQFGNAQIIGVNKGSIDSHNSFAKKHKLNFPILSDPGHEVTSAYGAWRSNKPMLLDKPFGTRRNTYIINPSGHIVKTYLSVDPNNHAEQIINDLQELQSAERSSVVKSN